MTLKRVDSDGVESVQNKDLLSYYQAEEELHSSLDRPKSSVAAAVERADVNNDGSLDMKEFADYKYVHAKSAIVWTGG